MSALQYVHIGKRVKQVRYVFAEYCPGDFFWGWHLYAAPVVDGKPDCGRAVWLQHGWQLDHLMSALGLPVLHEYRYQNHERYTHAFLRAYPDGLLAEVEGDCHAFEVLPAENLWDYARQVREAQLLDWKKALHSARTERLEAACS